jgi:thymidylate kinase
MTVAQRLTLTVAVEGCDGTGKSTLAEALASHLRLGLGTPALKIKRPAPDSEAQRLFADPTAADEDRLAAMDRDCADRLVDAAEAFVAGTQVVIFDRHFLSAAVYQGGDDWLDEARRQQTLWPQPDLWIITTANIETVLSRIAAREADHDHDTPRIILWDRLARYAALAYMQTVPVLVVSTDERQLRVVHIPPRGQARTIRAEDHGQLAQIVKLYLHSRRIA